jgi:hypothetical protein
MLLPPFVYASIPFFLTLYPLSFFLPLRDDVVPRLTLSFASFRLLSLFRLF